MFAILDRGVELKLNAVLLQVRPSCDAIYPSTLEPWSEFLTGASGKPPAPSFDPLAEWIDAAHARGLELHAWFNPFRARHQKAEHPDAPSHISNTRPDLVRTWGDLKWLDPSEPDARAHSMRVILDVVTRYQIDGVHLDDYFYPYPRDVKSPTGAATTTRKEEFPDEAQWSKYRQSGGSLSRSDWRRSHIDGFVKDLYQAVKAARPSATFGISPFGIWRPGNPPVVEGFDSFEGLFADARRWLKEGWIDYLAPQLYWSIDSPKQPFEPLLDWWLAENTAHKQIWPGLYTSRIEGEGKWKADEILRQIASMRARKTCGHAHFSMATFMHNRGGVADALKQDLYADDAIVPDAARSPAGDFANGPAITAVASVSQSPAGSAGGVRLWWSAPDVPQSAPPTRRWIVQARYGPRIRTLAFAPSSTGTDLPSVDASGAALDHAWVTRVDAERRCSNTAPVPIASITAAPPRGS